MIDSEASHGQNVESGRLGYFPVPYRDETIFSILARFRQHLGISHVRTMQRIYGRTKKSISHLMPASMDLFSSVIEPPRGYSFERLISEHTAINYYTAFMSREERERMVAIFLMGEKKGAPGGTWAVPFISTDHLRFCRSCRHEQMDRQEEAYWRLSHQIPLVTICLEHDEVLRDSIVSSANPRIMLQIPDDMNCPDAAYETIRGHGVADIGQLRTLAEMATDLLNNRFPDGLHQDWREAEIIDELDRKDFRYPQGKVRWEQLTAHLKGVFAGIEPAFPTILHGGDASAWFLDQRPKNGHPHTDRVILAKFAIDRLPRRDVGFGTGPWPCFNRLADHFGQRVVEHVERIRKAHGTLHGRFRCHCGYEYSRSIDPLGQWSRPVISRFGPTLDQHIAKAVQKEWTLVKTHTMAGIDLNTMLRHAKKQGIRHPWRAPRSTK